MDWLHPLTQVPSPSCHLFPGHCSLDVSAKSRVVVTGDNVGNVILLNMDGKEVRSWELGSSLSFPYPQPPFSAST